MDTEDGRVFIKNLAYYVRTHEKALANALHRPQPSRGSSADATNYRPATTSSLSSITSQRDATTLPSPSGSFSPALSLPSLGFSTQNIKPAKLYLTPNQLYYLLCRFEELGVLVGPLNVRLESIYADSTSMNYVSFLTQTKRPKGRSSDQDSIHSVSSVRSVMSSMSSLFSGFNLSSNSTAKVEKRKAAELEDIRYLYSAFTKIPCLKLVSDHRIRRITGYEEFPFDTAVPLYVFKNITVLEIVDQDFRSFFGWDRLAENLRSLTVKRGKLDDPADLLTNIVLDDIDKRRRRSTRAQASPTLPFSMPSPALKHSELIAQSPVAESPPFASHYRPMDASTAGEGSSQSASSSTRLQSVSPPRPSRLGSGSIPTKKQRRPSTSSTSSNPSHTPRNSSSNLLLHMGGMPANKWRFLRHLSLADNGLTFLKPESLQPLVGTLQSLDLSSNLFHDVPDSLASLISLRALNLSNCMIQSLHTLARSPLPAITVLNLKGNRLESLAGIEKLLSLERFDIRENHFKDPTEIARLTGMPNFRDVYVAKNPFAKTHGNFRITIFNLFRKSPGYTDDITIDSAGPSSGERRQLADRVPEPMSVPVVKPILEDFEDTVVTNPPAVVDSTHVYAEGIRGSLGEAEPADAVLEDKLITQNIRKKAPRRRVVDMEQGDSPRTPGSPELSGDAMFVTAAQPLGNISTLRRRATDGSPSKQFSGDKAPGLDQSGAVRNPSRRSKSHISEHEQTDVAETASGTVRNPARRSKSHFSEHEQMDVAETASPGSGPSSSQYRQRIDALKKEYGNGWLGALGDDNWTESTAMTYGTEEVGKNSRQSVAKT